MKHKVKEITVTRGEGPSKLCDIEHVVKSYDEANNLLDSWRQVGDKHADKCDFKIVWDDPDSTDYKGTYFLDHSKSQQSLNGHIKYMVQYYAGLVRPDHYTDLNWETHLKNIASYKDDWLHLYQNFEI